jgi:D-glycero-D-manno-heptose 1,7-bisphosphate phosphatase
MEKPNRAVLFDIDGIFVVDRFATRVEDVELILDLGEHLDALVEKKFLLIGHTNKPDLARKRITPEFLAEKHALIQKRYPQLQKIFVCPHTDTDMCSCRKPKPGLLLQAQREFNLALAECWVVGDYRRDMEAGRAVYARTAFVQTPLNCGDLGFVIANLVAQSTRGVLELILAVEEGRPNLTDA